MAGLIRYIINGIYRWPYSRLIIFVAAALIIYTLIKAVPCIEYPCLSVHYRYDTLLHVIRPFRKRRKNDQTDTLQEIL